MNLVMSRDNQVFHTTNPADTKTAATEKGRMANQEAPAGQVFVCGACGKRSRDEYGINPIDRGWDESCMMNSFLVYEKSIVLEGGRVKAATAVKKE